jgi:hypothetical protein
VSDRAVAKLKKSGFHGTHLDKGAGSLFFAGWRTGFAGGRRPLRHPPGGGSSKWRGDNAAVLLARR